MANICGVRFKQAGKVFYFDAGELQVASGAYVVAETVAGIAMGKVVIAPDQVLENDIRDDLKPILRLATQEDFEQDQAMKDKAAAAAEVIRQKIAEQATGMSLASVEYDLDGGQATVYFTAGERADFRTVQREVARELGVGVQFLQVGDRDRAKLVDGLDICGERLCCSSWMTNFPSVSIRMAKEQDLPLNPQKISGVCGRLYCCLTFEFEDYKALRGTLPKVGSMLSTPAGEAKVSSIDFNREVVKLWLTESRSLIEIAAVDLKLQHGVTVRPMEIVHKIEGPLRPITEDTRGRGRIPARPPRQGQPEGMGNQGQRPNRPPRPERPAPGQANTQPAQPAPSPAGEGEAQKRRRRRRRGRGGGGGGGSDENQATSDRGLDSP